MTAIATCLWFDHGKGEEAARFYTSLIPGSSIDSVWRFPSGAPGPEHEAMLVEFTLGGAPYQILCGGPQFPLSEAVSIALECVDQPELDRYWDALIADGGEASQCGWLRDRWGLSWQLVPRSLNQRQRSGEPERIARMMQAMYRMTKLDAAALEAAYQG